MSIIYFNQAGVDTHRPSSAGCWCSRDFQSFTSKHQALGMLLLVSVCCCCQAVGAAPGGHSWNSRCILLQLSLQTDLNSSPCFMQLFEIFRRWAELVSAWEGVAGRSLTGKSCLEIPDHCRSWWDHCCCVSCGFHSGYFIVLDHGGRGNQCGFAAFQTSPECSDSFILMRSCDPESTLALGSSLHICLHLPGAPVHSSHRSWLCCQPARLCWRIFFIKSQFIWQWPSPK